MLSKLFSGDAIRRLEQENAELRRQVDEARAGAAKLESETAALRAEIEQLRDPLPPDHLQTRQVGGAWGRDFFRSGKSMFQQIEAAFREAGEPLDASPAILDFGCGCGRVLWSFQHYPHTGEVWGADVDAEAIAWDRAHFGKFAQFRATPALPPTGFPDGYFSAIYAISVFTHFPEDVQFVWLAELRRILRPGGVMLASLHGARYWRNSDAELLAEVEARGFGYRDGPPTPGMPDYYMVSFHSEDYIRTRWSRYFDVIGHKAEYIHDVHDAAILRRRAD